MKRGVLLVLLVGACTQAEAPDDSQPEASGARVELTTRDDVLIVGDAWLHDAPAPGVVFLHMTPAGPWSRTDWPVSLMQSLHEQGLAVIRIDRRGAGESGGEAEDAFDGLAGRLDVEAAVLHLADHGLTTLGVVGASNGSTSAVDYAAWAFSEELPPVAALGLMSPGTYTENQTAVAELPPIPTLVQYPAAEDAWPDGVMQDVPESWRFVEYSGAAHGTQLFEAEPEVAVDLSAFLSATLLE